jgi:hypothetical protein
MRIGVALTFTVTTFAISFASRQADALESGAGEPLWSSEDVSSENEPELEYRYRDVRVRLDSGKGSWEAEIAPSFTTTDYRKGTINEMRSLRLDFIGSSKFTTRGGKLWGAGIEVDRWHGALMTEDAAFGVAALNLYAGYAFAIGTQAQLEVVGVGQLGMAVVEDKFAGAVSPRLDGAQLGFGADVNLVLLRQSGWHLAGSVGARYGESHLSNDDSYSVTLRSQGWTAGLAVGRRL